MLVLGWDGLRFFIVLCCRAGKQNSSEFSRLVAQVKGRMETAKRLRQIKQEKEAASEETSREGEANKSPHFPPVPRHTHTHTHR